MDIEKPELYQSLERVFASTQGLKEIRLIKERGVAFVEYENEQLASIGLDMVKQTEMLKREISPSVKCIYAKKWVK